MHPFITKTADVMYVAKSKDDSNFSIKFEVIYVDSFCTFKIQLIVSLNKVLYKCRCQRLRAIALALKNLASISLRMIELITYKFLGHRKMSGDLPSPGDQVLKSTCHQST